MESGGTLSISWEACFVSEEDALPLPAGEYLHLCFSDTGVGIAPQDLSRVFDPYWAGNPLGTRDGIGLGLTLCFSIVKKHKGFIVAESESGCGAAFHVYLPAAVKSASPAVGG
jgi:signal transduction histidine kinase